jgi:hypothetical protein
MIRFPGTVPQTREQQPQRNCNRVYGFNQINICTPISSSKTSSVMTKIPKTANPVIFRVTKAQVVR